MSLSSVTPDIRDIDRYIGQIERKRQYNRDYYHRNVKPKKEQQKQELEQLRERVAQLDISNELANCQREISRLTAQNQELTTRLRRQEQELLATRQALEVSRQRNFQLMSIKADQILPDLEGLTLPT